MVKKFKRLPKHLYFDVSEEMHQKVKEHCAERGTTVKRLITDLLEKKLGGK